MKPPPFSYAVAESVEHAISLLADADGEGKLIAGGQSLMPMLNFRLLEPELLIDIGRVPELDTVSEANGGLSIGALTRHATLEHSPLVKAYFPVLSFAMTHVAHLAVRNRGTIGGSLSHSDPAAELPMMAMLLDAEISISGPQQQRGVAARDFFLGALDTDLDDTEMVTGITLPALPSGSGWGFEEVSRRAGDFAIAAAAAVLRVEDGVTRDVRLAVTGVDETPLRMSRAEAFLNGKALDEDVLSAAAYLVRSDVNPNTDQQASSDYRRHLVGALVKRVLRSAWLWALEGAR
ncbi:MAG: xanthine dehydrogenase family protein subunit M [Pseudomonadota bacterium]